MTYPPQGPYGQQQPPPAGPPPGWGQQGQQPSGWQQQGWDPNIGWQQGWDAGEPPEPKKRTGLVVGVIVAVLLLIGGAVAVTGFWKPGFFLSDDEKTTGGDQPSSSAPQSPGPTSGAPTGIPKPSIQPPGGGGAPSTPPAGGGGDETEVLQVAQLTADGFNERDQDKFSEQFCEPEEARKLKLDSLPPDAKMTLTGDPAITGDKATVPVEITMSGDKRTDKMPLEKRDGDWCTSAD